MRTAEQEPPRPPDPCDLLETGDWTVYVTSMGARDHEDVVAALRYLLGQAGPGMTESSVQLELSAYTLDPTAAAIYRVSTPTAARCGCCPSCLVPVG